MNKNSNSLLKNKEALLKQGVNKLKILGFNNVNVHNILIDEIYQLYFLSFLKNISYSKNEDEIIAIKELELLITTLFEVEKSV